MDINKVEIAALLEANGLGEYKEAILEYAKPCIRLHASLVDEANVVAVGESHIGGLPDLPLDVTWPMRNGRSCEFIAQINLRDVAPFDEEHLLPRDGMLLFFFDGRDYEDKPYVPYQTGGETIIYYDGDIQLLKRAADFPEAMEKWQCYRMCSVQFKRGWMLPTWWSQTAYDLEENVFHFNHKTTHDVPPIVETYRELAEGQTPYKDCDKHHLFGHPEPIIQDDPLTDIPGVWDGQKLNQNILAEWMIFLQISSDWELTGMLWGDTSSLYYCIRKQDLLARQFEKALCFEQNH